MMSLERRRKRLERLGWRFHDPVPAEIATVRDSGYTIVQHVRPARYVAEKSGPRGHLERIATTELGLIEQIEENERDWAQRGYGADGETSTVDVVDGASNAGAK